MMTAEQLKASILQMAMQGKLVEQRAEEGTGEDLLKQIAEVKNRLFKTGKFKKENKLADINSEEILFEIPASWTWVRLNYFGQFSSGKTPSMSDAGNWGGNIPWTTSKDMKSDVIHDSMMHITKKAADQMHIYPAGTLLMVVRSGILKRSLPLCILGIDSTINQDLKAFEFYDDQVFQWIYYALKGFEPYILKNLVKRVTTVDSLKFDEFSNLALPFPPLEEQKRIVAKIEELMPFVEQYAKASTRLNALNASFPDQMKKSILQQAVMGKLVPQDPTDEPASVLLKKIAEEKQKLIETGVVKKDKKASSIFRGDDGLFYETIGKKTECIQDQLPFDIPDTWEWIRLRGYGEFSSGKTPSMSNPKNWIGDIPWVSPKDMKTDVISDSQMHISKEACNAMNLYPKGTLLMVVRSGILKRMLPLCVLGVDATINQDLKAFRFYYNELSEWIYYELKGFEHYILHNLVKNVTTVDSLKFDEFTDMLVPVPPRQEQIRIIQQLKVILPMIDTTWKK